MTKFDVVVSGLHCKSCSLRIKMALEDISAKSIVVDFDEKALLAKVSCEFVGQKSDIVSAIEGEGYKVQ